MNVSNPRPKIPRMHNQEANTLRMSEGKLSGLAATINKRNEVNQGTEKGNNISRDIS